MGLTPSFLAKKLLQDVPTTSASKEKGVDFILEIGIGAAGLAKVGRALAR